MIIHGPPTLPYDIDVGPILVTDYYHRDYLTVLRDVMGTVPAKVPAFSDNNLINGRITSIAPRLLLEIPRHV